jgi:hypothetical protein
MGRSSAEDMVAIAGAEQALYWHLTGNHYPPIHPDFHPFAKQAIDLANAGDWDTVLTLPNGVDKSVAGIIKGLHLEPFLDQEED